MKIQQFMTEYCQDILKDYKNYKQVFQDTDNFYYEKLEKDESGNLQKVIFVNSKRIFINDILAMDIKDFEAIYPGEDMKKARSNYLYNIIMTEGEDVLIARRKAAMEEKERIERFKKNNISGLF